MAHQIYISGDPVAVQPNLELTALHMMGLPCVLKRRFLGAEITLGRPMHWTAVLMVRLMLSYPIRPIT